MLAIENVHPDPIIVYTDGACKNNGKPNARAAYGVYFGQNDKRNVAKLCDSHQKQTNNVAELLAIINVFFILENEITNNKDYVLIVSDSIYAIRACTSYGEKCAKKNWKFKKEIPNLDLVKQAYLLYLNRPNVQFMHVEAHTNKKDKHSLGNYYADKLATSLLV